MANYNYSSSYTQNMPAYKQPKYDYERIRGLAQEQMAPGLAKLRRGLASSTAMYSDNPAERDAMLREARAGEGQALGELQAGATRAAQGLYSQEYSGLEKQAEADWQTAQRNWQLRIQEQERLKTSRDPRGPHPPSYSSWAEYDAAVAASRPTGGTNYMASPRLSMGGGGGEKPWYQKQQEDYEAGRTSPMIYGAGSEEAYKRAIREGELATGGYSRAGRGGQPAGLEAWNLGGGKTGLSLLTPQTQQHLNFNPFT